MPVYLLGADDAFPPPEGANEDGVVAVGGDLTPERLFSAYQNGIFPWPAKGYPLLWFSPDPRFTLAPSEAHVPRSLRRLIRKQPYRITFDQAFDQVIDRCAEVPRPNQDGTWITDQLRDGYKALHQGGHAHSVEAWKDDELVGGLYGVAVGKAFAGESMFTLQPDASKIAFITLLAQLATWDFAIVDCQVHTEHLERFGARMQPRRTFLRAWRHAATGSTGSWTPTMTPTRAVETLVHP